MKYFLYLFLFSLIVGCASKKVIIDTKGVNLAQYEQDLSDCRGYQAQVNDHQRVASNAGIGAAIGAAVALVTGGDSDDASRAGGLGAIKGGVGTILEDDHTKDKVVKRCMSQRGYRVLN